MNKLIIEFLGTLFFIYVILATENALAIGAAMAIAILVGGKISGGHFNPAVTSWALLSGKISQNKAIGYIIAQLLAALFVYFLNGVVRV